MTIPTGGGLGLGTSTGDGPVAPVDYFGPLLRGAVEQAWSDLHPKLEAGLTQQLGAADLIRSGFTLYDISVDISKDLSYAIDRDGDGNLRITVTTGGNSIRATSTQPTALGSWADPEFSVSFALTFSYVIDVPPVTSPLSATGFRDVRVLDPQIHPHGIVADLAFFINDLIAWFSGVDYVARVEGIVAAMDFAPQINQALAPLNAEVTTLASQGYWFLEAVVDRLDGESGTLHAQSFPGAPADQLDVLLIARAYDRSGVIEGELHWPAALGRPVRKGLVSDRIDVVSAVAIEGLRETTVGWAPAAGVIPDVTPALGLAAAAAAAAAGTGKHDALDAVVPAAPVQDGETPIAAALSALPADARATAVAELRRGSASRFSSLVGQDAALRALREFATGRSDFVVTVQTAVGGAGLLPDMREAGRLAGLFAADDDQTGRRRYRLVDVVTDASVTVTAAIAPSYEWVGSAAQVAVTPDGWRGQVTVHPAKHLEDDIVVPLKAAHARLLDAAHSAGTFGDEVALNPQPLPPKEVFDEALDPQPIPQREHLGLRDAVARQVVRENVVAQPRLADGIGDRHIAGRRAQDVVEGLAVRDNPTGDGVVTGVDFAVREYTPPVIR